MRPSELTPASFANYPPEARALAVKNLPLFRTLPLAFLPLLLRELITYDWKFPAEREELDFQLRFLNSQSPAQIATLLNPFNSLQLSTKLESVDWVNVPAQFSEDLSAYLWATSQIDQFRQASTDYVHKIDLASAHPEPPMARLSLVMVGKDAGMAYPALFQRFQAYGTRFTNLDPSKGVDAFYEAFEKRASTKPSPFAHWYIDGSVLPKTNDQWTCISYDSLQPVRAALLERMTKVMRPGGGGPELLRSELQRMRPEDVGLSSGASAVLSHFQLSLLTEGSGTQIFSTTFVQWAAREALRRAQPWTLLLRFAPRRRPAPIGSVESAKSNALDPDGSLIDADMGAWYTWINQQRLRNSAGSRFIAWYEGHNQAVVVGGPYKAGAQDTRPLTVKQVLDTLA